MDGNFWQIRITSQHVIITKKNVTSNDRIQVITVYRFLIKSPLCLSSFFVDRDSLTEQALFGTPMYYATVTEGISNDNISAYRYKLMAGCLMPETEGGASHFPSPVFSYCGFEFMR